MLLRPRQYKYDGIQHLDVADTIEWIKNKGHTITPECGIGKDLILKFEDVNILVNHGDWIIEAEEMFIVVTEITKKAFFHD